MSIDATRPGGRIKNALIAIGAVDTPATEAFALEIASAIIDEITGHADVLPDLPSDPTNSLKVGAASVIGKGRIA